MISARLWRTGPFARFFLGASLSILGNWFNTVAIAVLAYRLTGRAAFAAAALLAAVLPRVLLAPLGGALADRWDRRTLLLVLDGARIPIALVPLLVHDAARLWLVYVAVALLQVAASIYNPAQRAYVPRLVPDDLLEPANAAVATMSDLGMFLGPALAAVALGFGGTAAAFWGNAGSFLLSAGLLLTLPRAPMSAARSIQPRALFMGYAALVRRYPRIAALCLAYLGTALPVFFLQAIMVAYARALGQPTTFVGALYAAAGVGGALGGLITGQYLRRLSYPAVLALFTGSVPALGALALVHQAVPALLLMAGSAAAATAGDVLFTVLVQRGVPSAEQGRAFGLLFWCVAVGQLLGAALGVALAPVAMPALLGLSVGVFPLVLGSVLLAMGSDHMPRRRPAPAGAREAT